MAVLDMAEALKRESQQRTAAQILIGRDRTEKAFDEVGPGSQPGIEDQSGAEP